MIEPVVAAVRPRIVSPATGDALLLEDFVFTTAAKLPCGSIHLDGPSGSGKTTALRHLAATILPHFPIILLDQPDLAEVSLRSTQRLVVYSHRCAVASSVSRRLATWGDDDLIEYLLARHPDRAAQLFRRFQEASDRRLTQGLPEISRIVIDRMACDTTITRVADAVRMVVHNACEELGDPRLAAQYCQRFLRSSCRDDQVHPVEDSFRSVSIPSTSYLARLLRLEPIRNIMTAELIFDELVRDQSDTHLRHRLTREIVGLVAEQVASTPGVIDRLQALANARVTSAPMAASILHAARVSWIPDRGEMNLQGAFLDNVRWKHANLIRADLRRSDFGSADLAHANLTGARADSADFESASLAHANISSVRFDRTQLTKSAFRDAKGEQAIFSKSDLSNADFRDSRLPESTFRDTCLRGAIFVGADLQRSLFLNTDIETTDFRNVNFRSAHLSHLRLRLSRLDGAVFTDANLCECDLEYIHMVDAKFAGALLSKSYLTGSILQRANFRGANLTATGLGDIDWEGADLRDADLRGCSFHLGSTRCGLVDSPYPSEGTRTGFYTDDYDDRYFRAPEEIRKASLRGANLLGAKVDGVDFYLVDLRDAVYGDAQRHHFMQTGAILHAAQRD